MSNVNNVNNFFVSKVYDPVLFFANSPINYAAQFDKTFALHTNLLSRILANICIAPLVIAGTAYTWTLAQAINAVAILTHAIALAVAGVMDLCTAPDQQDSLDSFNLATNQ